MEKFPLFERLEMSHVARRAHPLLYSPIGLDVKLAKRSLKVQVITRVTRLLAGHTIGGSILLCSERVNPSNDLLLVA